MYIYNHESQLFVPRSPTFDAMDNYYCCLKVRMQYIGQQRDKECKRGGGVTCTSLYKFTENRKNRLDIQKFSKKPEISEERTNVIALRF